MKCFKCVKSIDEEEQEELGCINVYLCRKCNDAKPRKDFFKYLDTEKMEEVWFKTCKDCRDTAKETREKKSKSVIS